MKNKKFDKKQFFDAFSDNGIARSMTLYIILFSSLATLIFTALQLYNDYKQDIEIIDNNFKTIGSSQLTLLSNSIWSLNNQQIQTQLNGLLQLQDIEYVAVINNGEVDWSSGQKISENNKEKFYTIEFTHHEVPQNIGTLVVRASIDSVYNRIRERLITLLINNGLKTFFVSLFMLIIFQFMVTRHLNRIASYAQSIDITDDSKQKLNLGRSSKIDPRTDELEKVVSSINSMRANVVSSHLQLKKSEKQLSIMLHDAETANRSKSDFLAAMSHDLRTPLNAILGFSEMMKKEILGPLGSEKYNSYANDIHHSGKYLLGLINDILDISKIEAGERLISKESINFNNITKHCYEIVKLEALEKNIECIIKVKNDMEPVLADHQALMQIMMNLTSNAIKFTPAGGSVTISASFSKKTHTIKVKDTGIGISEKNLATITDPFTRAESDPYKAHEGTGLGLAIVKSLVELHGGTIGIKSKINKGTTVTIKLPSV